MYRIKKITEKNNLGEIVNDKFIVEKKVLWWWTDSTAMTLSVSDNVKSFWTNTLSFSTLEDAQKFKEYLEGEKHFIYKGESISKYLDVDTWRLGHGYRYLYLLDSSIKYYPSSTLFTAITKRDIKELQFHIDKTSTKKTVNYNVELEAEAERYNL